MTVKFISHQVSQLNTKCYVLVHPMCAYFSPDFKLKSFLNIDFKLTPINNKFKKLWCPFICSEWIIRAIDFKIFTKKLKSEMKELRSMNSGSAITKDHKSNPMVRKYPMLILHRDTRNNRKCVKSNIISINISNPKTIIKSIIELESDIQQQILNASLRTSSGRDYIERCYLCNKPIQRGVDGVVECDVTGCKDISHIHCSLFEKYLETTLVTIEDNLKNDIPIIRFNQCMFKEVSHSKKIEKKIKTPNNDQAMIDLLGGLICVKFDDSVNSIKKLKTALVDLFNIFFENDSQLQRKMEHTIEEWFDKNKIGSKFKCTSMINQQKINDLMETMLKQLQGFNFSEYKAYLKLPLVNLISNYFDDYDSMVENKSQSTSIKTSKGNINLNRKPIQSDVVKKQAIRISENASLNTNIKKCVHLFELNKNFNQDFYSLMNKTKYQPGKLDEYKELLFPYQRGLYDRIKSLMNFEQFIQKEKIEYTLNGIAPIFKGLCTRHFSR